MEDSLCRFAKLGDFSSCKLLLSMDRSYINVLVDGYTALHHACFKGHRDVVRLLLQHNADPNVRNQHGENAIEAAIQGKHFDLAGEIEALASSVMAAVEPLTVPRVEIIPPQTSTICVVAASSGPVLNLPTAHSSPITSADKSIAVPCTAVADTLLSRSDAVKYRLVVSEEGEAQPSEKVYNMITSGTNRLRDDLTIGRSRQNDVMLQDLSVSKQHAVVSYFLGVGFFVRDLSSKHGTFVDGVKVSVENSAASASNPLRLQPGSRLQFGRVSCEVRLADDPPPETPVISVGRSTAEAVEQAVRRRHAIEDELDKKRRRVDRENVDALAFAKAKLIRQSMLMSEAASRASEAERDVTAPVPGSGSGSGSGSGTQAGEELLQRLGWVQGTALGRSGDAAAGPLEVYHRMPRAGLGMSGSVLKAV